MADPDKLYNTELAGNQWRAIDHFKDDKVRMRELKNLVRSAVEFNLAKVKVKTKSKTPGKKTAK